VSHYSSSPREDNVVIHHTAGAHHNNNTCSFGDGSYDFAVGNLGTIYVCAHSSGTPYWQRQHGAHALNGGCNSDSIGIVMNGCFGCGGSHPTNPTEAQRCAVAFLISHLGTPNFASRHRPHAWCHAQDGSWTACPGANFTSSGTTSKWSSAGASLRDGIRNMRTNWDAGGCCFPPGDPRCPV
jgi:hypothetical protein